jgi:hypothetical protein
MSAAIRIIKDNNEIELGLSRADEIEINGEKLETFIAQSETYPDCSLKLYVKSGIITTFDVR